MVNFKQIQLQLKQMVLFKVLDLLMLDMIHQVFKHKLLLISEEKLEQPLNKCIKFQMINKIPQKLSDNYKVQPFLLMVHLNTDKLQKDILLLQKQEIIFLEVLLMMPCKFLFLQSKVLNKESITVILF
jgi:hypothetical protein